MTPPFALAVDHPAVLALLPLALLPLLASPFTRSGHPAVGLLPADPLSRIADGGLRGLAILAIAALVLGLAGLHLGARTVERLGLGARVVLLLDRSNSMDNTFANRAADEQEESKSAAARRLLDAFIQRRPHDRVGVAAFSTAPIPVLPMTDHLEAVRAAIHAIDRPGLAKTDVGRGLALALSLFREDPAIGPEARVLLLVSDGAAVIDPEVQDALRESVARTPVHLYWLFLRTKGSRGIFDEPAPGEDTPQAMPERHLHLFLSGLGIPYQAFEADSPDAVAAAIEAIDKQETHPLRYAERIPRHDLAGVAYALATGCVALLLLAKLAERPLSREGVMR